MQEIKLHKRKYITVPDHGNISFRGILMNNFDFLNVRWPRLYQLSSEAEQNLYTDPETSLIKLRKFGEAFAQIIMYKEGLNDEDKNQITHLSTLKRTGIVPDYLIDMLHSLRKSGGSAAHEDILRNEDPNYRTEYLIDSLKQLLYAYRLAVWLMNSYGESHFSAKPFKIPEKFSGLHAAESIIQKQVMEIYEGLINEAAASRDKASEDEEDPLRNITKIKSEDPLFPDISKFKIEGLQNEGFLGFKTIRELNQSLKEIPDVEGIYIVWLDKVEEPEFLETSTGGWFKEQNPTEEISV